MFGLRQFLQRGNKAAIGVAFGGDRLSAARVLPADRDRAPRLLACDDLAADPGALADWVERHGTGRAVGVLARTDYQVLSLEAPSVPAAELRRAVGWHVRELIDYPLDEAVIDTFELPESAQRGRRMLYVVVARRASVVARIEQMTRAGLTVDAVDIPELAQREISDRLGGAGGHGLLALGAEDGLLTIYRDGEHYFARTLDLGRTALIERGSSASAELVLEVQRSLDYYESALSQPPLNTLLLFPADEATEVLRQAVDEQFRGVTCRAVGLADMLAAEDAGSAAGPRTLHAVGGALRAGGQALGAAA